MALGRKQREWAKEREKVGVREREKERERELNGKENREVEGSVEPLCLGAKAKSYIHRF